MPNDWRCAYYVSIRSIHPFSFIQVLVSEMMNQWMNEWKLKINNIDCEWDGLDTDVNVNEKNRKSEKTKREYLNADGFIDEHLLWQNHRVNHGIQFTDITLNIEHETLNIEIL